MTSTFLQRSRHDSIYYFKKRGEFLDVLRLFGPLWQCASGGVRKKKCAVQHFSYTSAPQALSPFTNAQPSHLVHFAWMAVARTLIPCRRLAGWERGQSVTKER